MKNLIHVCECVNFQCTLLGNMMAYNEPHGIDIITSRASTVAIFKTEILGICEILVRLKHSVE